MHNPGLSHLPTLLTLLTIFFFLFLSGSGNGVDAFPIPKTEEDVDRLRGEGYSEKAILTTLSPTRSLHSSLPSYHLRNSHRRDNGAEAGSWRQFLWAHLSPYTTHSRDVGDDGGSGEVEDEGVYVPSGWRTTPSQLTLSTRRGGRGRAGENGRGRGSNRKEGGNGKGQSISGRVRIRGKGKGWEKTISDYACALAADGAAAAATTKDNIVDDAAAIAHTARSDIFSHRSNRQGSAADESTVDEGEKGGRNGLFKKLCGDQSRGEEEGGGDGEYEEEPEAVRDLRRLGLRPRWAVGG